MLVVLAAYSATRLALVWRFPPFFDEALYASWTASVHDDASMRFVSLAGAKDPMLSWIGAAVMQLGIAPLTAVRLVSVASGAVSLAVAAVLARRLSGSWRAAAVASVLYVLLPFVVVHDVIGLMEPLVTATMMLALYLQVRLAERPRLDLALLLGIVLAVGLLTKETAELAVVLTPASLLCFDWSSRDARARLLRWVGATAAALAVAGIGYSTLRLSPLYYSYGATRAAIGEYRSLGAALTHPLRYAGQNWPGFRTELAGYLTLPLAIAAAVGVGLALRRRPRLALLLVIWIVATLVSAELIGNGPFIRYLQPMIPLLVAFMAYAIVRAWGLLVRLATNPLSPGGIVAAAAVAVLLVPALLFDGKILGNPATAAYPGVSDQDYATGWASGAAFTALGRKLQVLGRGRRIVVSHYDEFSPALELLLRDEPNIQILDAFSATPPPGSLTSNYVAENGKPIPRPAGFGSLRLIWVYRRPRNGVPLKLYERGVWAGGHFYPTPNALRAGLGLSDRQFDAFVNAHPAVKAWYDAVASGR